MTEEVVPAHYKWGPSGAHRWLICTDAPNAEAPYPDEVTEPSDEGTAAHWLLEQCLKAGQDCQEWLDSSYLALYGPIIPAGTGADPEKDDPGTVWDWPITGEMIESVQLAIDEVNKQAKKRGTKLLVEVKAKVQGHYGLREPVGGTADIVMYLPKSKSLYVLDFKYGRGHVVEVGNDRWTVNPQVGLYAICALNQLEKLLGERREVKWIVAGIIQPRAHHKAGKVRTKKITPFQLMALEGDMIEAVNGDPKRVPGEEQCAWCKAKPDCKEYHQWRGEAAVDGFEGEPPFPANNVPDTSIVAPDRAVVEAPPTGLEGMITRPSTALTLEELGRVATILPTIKKWAKEVEEEIRTRLLNDLQVPGKRLAPGKGNRSFGGDEATIAGAVDNLLLYHPEVGPDDIFEPRKLKSVAQVEKVVGAGKLKETDLGKLVTRVEGGPAVVDTDSDKPEYVKNGGFTGEVPPEEVESSLL